MSINNMKKRINYCGGGSQQARMTQDKLRSLQGALDYSYQAATIVLSDGRAFRGLINPDRIGMDLDCKELSIPFKAKQLYIPPEEALFDDVIDEGDWEELPEIALYEGTWDEMVPLSAVARTVSTESTLLSLLDKVEITEPVTIGVQEGDVIRWRETNTYWLVLLRRLEETAYFRGNIYRCRHQVMLDNGSVYWAYVRGPVEQQINWLQAGGTYFNKLNYSLLMRLSATEETIATFERFARIMIDGKPWEVQGVDRLSTPGILNVALKETYSNTIETNPAAVVEKLSKVEELEDKPAYTYIDGPMTVYPYDTATYEIKNHIDVVGQWRVVNETRAGMVKVVDAQKHSVTLQILTGKTGQFTLEYCHPETEEIFASSQITVASL